MKSFCILIALLLLGAKPPQSTIKAVPPKQAPEIIVQVKPQITVEVKPLAIPFQPHTIVQDVVDSKMLYSNSMQMGRIYTNACMTEQFGNTKG